MEKRESIFTKNFEMRLMPKLKMRIVVSCIFLSLLIFLFVYYKYGVILGRPIKEAPNEYLVGIISIIITALLTILLIADVFVAFFCAIFSIIPTRKSKDTGSIENSVQTPSAVLIQQGNKQIDLREESSAPVQASVETQTVAIVENSKKEHRCKPLPIEISDELEKAFIPLFVKKNQLTQLNSFEILKEQLKSKEGWVMQDLGRIALLIYESDVLISAYKSVGFRGWMIKFCSMVGRQEDCPKTPDKSTYSNFSTSSIDFSKMFSDLKNYYDKTGSDYIVF